jgi:hypothetical protein
MRLSEFVNLNEDGASTASTCSGSIAPVSMPVGGMISRNGGNFFSGTVSNDPFPNTPYKKKKKGPFQNSR